MEEALLEQLIDWVRNRYFGKYRGVVTDNRDDTSRGRIRVRVPAVWGDLEVQAMPCVPYAGDGVGVHVIPEVGAGVWVEFEGGDPSYPIWTGAFWADEELPSDEQGTRATPPVKIIRSAEGLMLVLNDDEQTITISDRNGSNEVKIEVQSGQVMVKGTQKVVVEAPNIELVENATQPVVLGNNLLEYLSQLVALYQSHTHPGELALGAFPITPAPPVPPFPSPTPALLSLKVKSG